MTKILLARHGRTEGNRDGVLVGDSDSPLTGRGREWAGRLGDMLRGRDIDRIVTSPLGRAETTARLMARRLGADGGPVPEIETRNELRELSVGRWQGRLRDEVLPPGANIREAWTFRPPEGESYADGQARLEPLVHELRRAEAGQKVLVVAHAALNRVFLRLWLGLAADRTMAVIHPHRVIYRLTEAGLVERLSPDRPETPGLVTEGAPD